MSNSILVSIIFGLQHVSPFVAGILAVALGEYGQMTPSDLSQELEKHAKNVVKGSMSPSSLLASLW